MKNIKTNFFCKKINLELKLIFDAKKNIERNGYSEKMIKYHTDQDFKSNKKDFSYIGNYISNNTISSIQKNISK